MNYLKGTIRYLKKSFIYLAAFAVLPATVMAFFMRPFGSVTFLPEYATAKISDFGDMVRLIFDLRMIKWVFPIILIFALLLVALNFGFLFSEKYFRVGKRRFRSAIKDFGSGFFPVLKSLTVMTLVWFTYMFLFSGLIVLLHLIISKAGNAPNVGNIIVTSILSVGLYVLLVYLTVPIYYWAPIMLVYGYSFGDAVIATTRVMAGKSGKLFVGFLLMYTSVVVIELLMILVSAPYALNVVVSFVMYVLLIVFVIAYVMVSVFDLTGLERRDLKKLY